ncbi:MAG: hypothetical protein ACKVUT_07255 [Gaiella sp.]
MSVALRESLHTASPEALVSSIDAVRDVRTDPEPEFLAPRVGRLGPVTTDPEGDQFVNERLVTAGFAKLAGVRYTSRARPYRAPGSVEPLQEWEGVVEWVDGGVFGARLTDLTKTGEDEFAQFELDEVSQGDVRLISPGAVFYWTIARETSGAGQRKHVSMIRFRRLPAIRATRRKGVQQEADWISQRLGCDDASKEADSISPRLGALTDFASASPDDASAARG